MVCDSVFPQLCSLHALRAIFSAPSEDVRLTQDAKTLDHHFALLYSRPINCKIAIMCMLDVTTDFSTTL